MRFFIIGIYYFYAICRSDTGFVCKSLKCTVKAWKKTYVINESMKKTHICALFIRSHAWFNTSLSFVYICVQVLIPLTLSFSILYIASKCQGGLAYCWLVLITLIYKYADCVAHYSFVQRSNIAIYPIMTLMHDFNITDWRAFIKAHDKYEHNILFYLPTHKEHAAVSFF